MNNKIDKFDLRKVILGEYLQIEEGLMLAREINPVGSFKSITVSGMGGSALPADVLKILIADILECDNENDIRGEFKIYQNRNYKLPIKAYDKSLNIICSYSGNTEETISAFQEALKNNLQCVGISNGGVVERLCKENEVPHIKIPYPFENFQPRMATGYFVFAIFQILKNIGIIKSEEFDYDKISEVLKRSIVESEERGKELARKLVNKTPIIYSTEQMKALAMIWKIKFNENSKVPAFWNYFPELNHNEMVGYTNSQASFYFLMLRDENAYLQNLKRFEITANLMKEKGLEVEIIDIKGSNIIEKIFTTLYLGDWVSYYLALEYDIDPTPVELVEEFKLKLKK